MKIIWDERKRLINLEKHGLDFALVHDLDWTQALIVPANDSPAGNKRWKATGLIEDLFVSVIFAWFGDEALSVISFRLASRSERREFEWSRSTRH